MFKPSILLTALGLLATLAVATTYAASKDDLTQKYQSMINKAYNNALNSTKPVTPPSKSAVSSGQAALTPNVTPVVPPVAAPPAPSQTPATAIPSAQPSAPLSAGSVTNPGSTSNAGPPNIFITPGSAGNSASGSSNQNSGSNVIHY